METKRLASIALAVMTSVCALGLTGCFKYTLDEESEKLVPTQIDPITTYEEVVATVQEITAAEQMLQANHTSSMRIEAVGELQKSWWLSLSAKLDVRINRAADGEKMSSISKATASIFGVDVNIEESSIFVDDTFYDYRHAVGEAGNYQTKESITWENCRNHRMAMDVYDSFWLLWDFSAASMENAVVYEAENGYCLRLTPTDADVEENFGVALEKALAMAKGFELRDWEDIEYSLYFDAETKALESLKITLKADIYMVEEGVTMTYDMRITEELSKVGSTVVQAPANASQYQEK